MPEPLVRFEVGFQIGKMHIEVSTGEKCVAQGSKNATLIGTEMVGKNQVQGGARLRFVFVMPVRIVPAAAVSDLLGGKAKGIILALSRASQSTFF